MKISANVLILFIIICFHFTACDSPGNINKMIAEEDQERILTAADQYLEAEPITVTASHSERSAGGLHDFYSEGDYWWPNPEDPEGPYIRKDGMTNPENFVAHRKAMRRLSKIVPALVAAFEITGDKKYASQALLHLKAWFMDPATRMNPNLLYAQAIKGRYTGRGIGIIDTLHLVEVARALKVLIDMGYLNENDQSGLLEWFRKYLHWMTTHPYGIDERDHGNNHSTSWALQVASFAQLLEDQEMLEFCRNFYRETLLPDQMATDGSFPQELDRTKPYGYMLFHMDVMVSLVHLLAMEQPALWEYQTADGKSIEAVLAFMYPYIKNKAEWPYPEDVMYYENWPVRHPSLLFGGVALDKPRYIELWESLEPDPEVEEIQRNFPIRQPLLWY